LADLEADQHMAKVLNRITQPALSNCEASMTDDQTLKDKLQIEERKHTRERRNRYETLRREQLGAAINLIMGLAAAGVGFCISRIADKDAHFSAPGTNYFLAALVILVITVALGMVSTWTRLCDFRLTAKIIGEELAPTPSQAKLAKWRKCTKHLGRWTWGLFWAQSFAFMIGVPLLAFSIWTLNRDHLFPVVERVTLNGDTVAPYVVTGKYSVDEATHHKQMADCKADLTRFVSEINSNQRKPGENLLIDAYDTAFLRGHTCANWAAEPLDKTSRDVIDELANLESLMMARERVRYEDVKARLDYYQKRFH
jgi:hypothetical protein